MPCNLVHELEATFTALRKETIQRRHATQGAIRRSGGGVDGLAAVTDPPR